MSTAREQEQVGVLVTGGASGLGAAIVEATLAAGGSTVVMDRRAPHAEVPHRVVDLLDADAAAAATVELLDEHPSVRAVVTAAGIDACGPIDEVDWQDWAAVIGVNLLGTAVVCRAATPHLRARQGRIVTIASTLGRRALPDATAYCASKFGVVGFSRALGAELAGSVGVTCLMPGGMATAFFDDRSPRYQPGPDADLADPGRIAEAVLFAATRPPGVDIRELLVCPAGEGSWP